jgi:hypothetical protein
MSLWKLPDSDSAGLGSWMSNDTGKLQAEACLWGQKSLTSLVLLNCLRDLDYGNIHLLYGAWKKLRLRWVTDEAVFCGRDQKRWRGVENNLQNWSISKMKQIQEESSKSQREGAHWWEEDTGAYAYEMWGWELEVWGEDMTWIIYILVYSLGFCFFLMNSAAWAHQFNLFCYSLIFLYNFNLFHGK